MAKKKVKKTSKKTKKGKSNKQKINIVIRNLVLFAILTLISFLLYSVSTNELLINFFYLIAMVLGFVAFAFLIILLVFFFMKK